MSRKQNRKPSLRAQLAVAQSELETLRRSLDNARASAESYRRAGEDKFRTAEMANTRAIVEAQRGELMALHELLGAREQLHNLELREAERAPRLADED